MNPVRYIRKHVFGMTQPAFAVAIGSTQPSVSRWEQAGRIPAEHQDIVRALGKDICAERGQQWCDSWFFEVPADCGADDGDLPAITPQPSHSPAQPGITS